MARQAERLGDARRDHGRPIADGKNAVDRPDARRIEQRPHRMRPRRKTGSGSPRPATDRRSRGTDRSQTQFDARAVRPPRQMSASDSRSSSPEQDLLRGQVQVRLRSVSHRHGIRLRAAIPRLVQVRHRGRASGERAPAVGQPGTFAGEGPNLVEDRPAVRGQTRCRRAR